MSRNPHLEAAIFKTRPKTYRALQRLVTSSAKAQKNKGKKGILGGDKFQPAFSGFKKNLYELCKAIDVDGDMVVYHMDDSWSRFREDGNYLVCIDHMLLHFKVLYPCWPDAYSFWDTYFKESQKKGIKRLNN